MGLYTTDITLPCLMQLIVLNSSARSKLCLQGTEEMMSAGSLAGFPVVDVTATLYDGSYHDVDSSVLAFQIAARAAFREGMRKGAVRLLEPIMKV